MALLRVGLREHDVQRRDPGVRDEPLPAVDHVLVALAAGSRPHRGTVRPRPGLRQRIRGKPLPTSESRQEPPLLLVAAGELDPERAELLHRDDQPARRAHLRQLLDHHQRHQRARTDPAVLLVEQRPEQVVLPEQLDHVPRKRRAPVDLRSPRSDPLPRQCAHELADLTLLVGQRIERTQGALV